MVEFKTGDILAEDADALVNELELVPGAVTDANRFLEEHPDVRARFERVADLVAGFESSFGLELLSTVHWVIARESGNWMIRCRGSMPGTTGRSSSRSGR